MKAYYRPILFEHNDNHESGGFIYHDESISEVRIVPAHDSSINGFVKLDGDDLVELIRLGVPILSLGQLEEITAVIKSVQEAFKEDT